MAVFTNHISDIARHMSSRELGMLACTCKEIRDASVEPIEVRNCIFPGDGFFDIYNLDRTVKLRLFNGVDKSGTISFSEIEFNGERYSIDLVLFNTDTYVYPVIYSTTLLLEHRMRSREVKALWIREFKSSMYCVYADLAVEHPAFADTTVIVNADKQ